MALIVANQSDVLEAVIRFPRVGAWHADLLVDTPDAMAGPVTITVDGGLTLQGTAIRSGEFVDANHLRVVAGAGGLGITATPKHYVSATVGTILGDLMATSGEHLSSTIDPSLLATGVDAWTTTAIPVGFLVAKLAANLGVTASDIAWRMLPDGSLWIGSETWPDLAIPTETYQILENAGEEGSMLVAVDRPDLTPGTTFEQRHVSYIEHHVGQGSGVQMRVWFEDDTPSDSDRMKKALAALVRGAAVKIDYRARYWAKVIAQSGGTVDVQPEAAGVPDMASVPLFTGLPGATVDGAVGGRVLVGWSGADPSKPFAESFDHDTTVAKAVLAATQLFLGGETGAEPPPKGTTYRKAEDLYLDAIAAAIVAIGGGLSALGYAGAAATITAMTAAQTAFKAGAAAYLASNAKVL